jgi:uracil-DNA glycosylase
VTAIEDVRAMKRLNRAFDDIELQVSIHDLPEISYGQRAFRRLKLDREVTRQLTDVDVIHLPQWTTSVDDDAGVQCAIVMAAPTQDDVKHQSALRSRSGRFLRAELEQHRLYPEDYHVLYASPRVTGRPPTDHELRLDRPLLLEAIELVECRYVLMVGAQAFSEWRSDVRVGWSHGRLGLWKHRWFVYGVESPDAMMHPQADVRAWRQSLAAFASMVREQRTPITESAHGCVRCGDPVWGYDQDAVAWCKSHLDKGMKGTESTKKHWYDPKTDGQIGMVLNMDRSA